jgi:Uncharacterised ACR, YagE family COG1723
VLRGLRTASFAPSKYARMTAIIEISPDKDELILPGGPVLLKAIIPEHILVIADALAKSVVLARDEREVSSVIDVVEPFARVLAEQGRTPEGRRAILKHIGHALLVQRRMSGARRGRRKTDTSGFTRGCRTNTSSRIAPMPGTQACHHLGNGHGAHRHHRYKTLLASGSHDRRADRVGDHHHVISDLRSVRSIAPR